MRDEERVAVMLGVYIKYGIGNVRASVAALHTGTASPDQQKMVAEFVDAIAGRP